ncbi:coiled-coil domain-containing protein 97 isoform X2 [Venturia canescens]|nr:coiled-coil domain-containing protein 97 isoform X2 [Venturia canescens]
MKLDISRNENRLTILHRVYSTYRHMSTKEEKEEMTLCAETADNTDAEVAISTTETIQPNSAVEDEILEHLAHTTASFKSQQKNDPELMVDEKKAIALELLRRSHSMFLAKFGKYLKKEHLNYFVGNEQDYEISYHLNQLKRYFDDNARQIDVKNRRYQALKMMVEKGEYFSETEMMKRNPLLYEHHIGRFLSEEQKKKRDNIDTTSITFVNLLLESIDRDRLRNVRKAQQEAEDEVHEENDSDDDSDEDKDEDKDSNQDKVHWGEALQANEPYEREKKENRVKVLHENVPFKEQQILREEFVTHMYANFLDGKDAEFDYSTVDDNEAYDNVETRTHDEEEKYFDSESPETVLLENVREENDSEDELEVYMRSLKEQCSTKQL